MKKQLMMAAAVAALTLSACGRQDNDRADGAANGSVNELAVDNGMAAGNQAAAATDQTFVDNAAASDMFEIESSRLALDKATLPSIKTYAEMMVTDHTKSSNEMKAAIAGLTPTLVVPTALPADKQAKIDALRGLTGAQFDRQYLADQRAGHQETLTKLRDYAASASAGPLKDHATKMIPIVERHLNMVEKIK